MVDSNVKIAVSGKWFKERYKYRWFGQILFLIGRDGEIWGVDNM
jgi:hypothetical protein